MQLGLVGDLEEGLVGGVEGALDGLREIALEGFVFQQDRGQVGCKSNGVSVSCAGGDSRSRETFTMVRESGLMGFPAQMYHVHPLLSQTSHTPNTGEDSDNTKCAQLLLGCPQVCVAILAFSAPLSTTPQPEDNAAQDRDPLT